MGTFTERLKAAFTRPKRRHVPAKQIDRWEGEGGALPPEEAPVEERTESPRSED
ncbi:hypothetical protein SAMN04489806_0305 [Paramicrobacterium humi]|uniref:Uncharacterized protein n=1 Tax=Paramicrobacterium humi TaxID=640635 RepID=A0A1H4IVR1_9MICO|nr:hypothetical protein [Microbacterium humi]SEB37945.1 hypothetical protein SAMN04489806_0305 [Microbacterium humi]